MQKESDRRGDEEEEMKEDVDAHNGADDVFIREFEESNRNPNKDKEEIPRLRVQRRRRGQSGSAAGSSTKS